MTENQINNQLQNSVVDDEIDLLALAKSLWIGRKTIIKWVAIGTVIGLFVAIFTPKQYSSSCTIVPQISKSSASSNLSSLAAMAGVTLDMNTSSDVLSPLVYPKIVGAANYQLELMNAPFTFAKVSQPVSLFEYFTKIDKPGFLGIIKKYTLGLPGVILGAIKGKPKAIDSRSDGPISLSEDQVKIREFINSNVTIDVNAKEGYLTLNTNMPEPILAAQVNQKAQELLQKYVTVFKIEKAQAQLNFVEGRYNEKKKEFEKAQERLAIFNDRNRVLSTSMAITERDMLQNEYQIAFNIFNEMAKQVEQARIKVKEDTPVFSVVEPSVVPFKKSKPNRPMILIVFVFLGGILGAGIVLGKDYLQTIKDKWNQSEKPIAVS